MGNTDSIPVVSQVKSLVQVIGGDEEGALKTQENFQRTGPIASQINSLVHHIKVRSCPYIISDFVAAFFDPPPLPKCSSPSKVPRYNLDCPPGS